MKRSLTLSIALSAFVFSNCTQDEMATSETAPEAPKPEKISEMTDEEWREKLTPQQYYVLREAGTDRPNGEIYDQFQKQGAGTYFCAGCDAELFTSTKKFDSHCGWPSFYDPSDAENVKQFPDPDGQRIEVRCKICDGHLGHVFVGERFNAFNGGTTPTAERYCINGSVLKFVPAQEEKSGE